MGNKWNQYFKCTPLKILPNTTVPELEPVASIQEAILLFLCLVFIIIFFVCLVFIKVV